MNFKVGQAATYYHSMLDTSYVVEIVRVTAKRVYWRYVDAGAMQPTACSASVRQAETVLR